MQSSRTIGVEDLAALRDIDTLSVAPDGRSFAILVRQADALANDYRTAWFVGRSSGGPLTYVGDGGEARLVMMADGRPVGDVGGSVSRWSPDGEWIAYLLKRAAQVQLWRSRADGSLQQQVSHNASDVREFAWSEDGRELFFTAGTARADLHAEDERERRNGVPLEKFLYFSEIIYRATPPRPLETDLAVWKVQADGGNERRTNIAEREEFERAQRRGYTFLAGGTEIRAARSSAAAPEVTHANGNSAWVERANPEDSGLFPEVRLAAALPARPNKTISCAAPECVGYFISKFWWSADGRHVIFWRKEGVNQTEDGLYAWSPTDGAVKPIFRSNDDWFRACESGATRLICLRETSTRPRHVVAVDMKTGRLDVLTDVNPEFAGLRLGKVERFEWPLPEDVAGLGYPRRARGFILYPPDFDPKRKYPVFVSPYGAGGFKRGDVGNEQPMLAYAANGFIVINSEFPFSFGSMGSDDQVASIRKLYSVELGFPHLTMLMESTFRALDAVVTRGFVDERRIGIGGVSHGTFIPLYMVQKYDRIAAVSVSAVGWTQENYYYPTRMGRALFARDYAAGEPWPEDPAFWAHIDLAEHVDTIEAPLLFHFSDNESMGAARLIRRLDNAAKPYDAYIFPDEHHVKWQPAHRLAVYNRNLDWSRFWLQDYEDPAPAKTEQYARWRELRKLQCKNPRSLRDYCQGNTTQELTSRSLESQRNALKRATFPALPCSRPRTTPWRRKCLTHNIPTTKHAGSVMAWSQRLS